MAITGYNNRSLTRPSVDASEYEEEYIVNNIEDKSASLGFFEVLYFNGEKIRKKIFGVLSDNNVFVAEGFIFTKEPNDTYFTIRRAFDMNEFEAAIDCFRDDIIENILNSDYYKLIKKGCKKRDNCIEEKKIHPVLGVSLENPEFHLDQDGRLEFLD